MQTKVPIPGNVIRLAYCLSHPIQYQEPLLRRIAAEPGIDLTVYYSSDFSARQYYDRGFGREVEWEIPLLSGYKYKILPRVPGTKNIYSARPPSTGYLRAFLRAKHDVVWVHGYHTANALHALIAAKLIGAKTLVRTDSTLLDRERSPAKQRARKIFFSSLRRLVDGVLPVGIRNAEYWRAMLGADVPQFTLPYAVDNGWFAERAAAAAQTREELRAELGLAPGRKVILFAAKLIERKRCVDLIQAYAQAFTSGAKAPSPGSAHIAGLKPGAPTNQAQSTPDQEERHPYLLIVGDGAEAERLKQRAAEIDADGIRFAGFRSQPEMPRFYDLCDVFCLPSVHEPWGLIVNEAMAAGRAVVVSDEVGSAADLVVDGETGFVHKARDVRGLADALRRVTSEPGLAAKMGLAGAVRIASWDYEADVRGLKAALEFVTAKRRSAKS